MLYKKYPYKENKKYFYKIFGYIEGNKTLGREIQYLC